MGVVNTMYRKHHKTPGVGGVFGDRWGAGGNASLPLRGIEHFVADASSSTPLQACLRQGAADFKGLRHSADPFKRLDMCMSMGAQSAFIECAVADADLGPF